MISSSMPKEAWYVIARSAELPPGTITQRWIHGFPVALFRQSGGELRALSDACAHRQLPLSMGRIEGETIRCRYHGLRFDGEGRCVEVPGQEGPPASLRIAAFPLVERSPFVWIWTGSPARARAADIPEHPWTADPRWTYAEGTKSVASRAELLNENLLDLSHLEFLHPTSIGRSGIAAAPIRCEGQGRIVRVIRRMPESEAAPFYTATMGVEGRIARLQTAEFFAPSFHVTHLTVEQGERQWTHKVLHGVTPATRSTTHYFWAIVRDYRTDDPSVTELQRSVVDSVFEQDAAACAAIERFLQAHEPGAPVEHHLRVDAGPLRARRVIESLLEAEQRAASAPPDHENEATSFEERRGDGTD